MTNYEYTFPDEVKLVKHDPDTGKEISRLSFAEIRGVYQSETYAAMGVGLRPEFRAVLPSWEDDYHDEQRLEWSGVPYRIIRAYRTDDGMAELTCTRLKSHVSDLNTGGIG